MIKENKLTLSKLVPEEYDVWETGLGWRKHKYRFSINVDGTLTVKYEYKPYKIIQTTEELFEVLKKVKAEIDELKEKELEIVEYIKTFDPSTLYDPNTGALFIFSERITFLFKRDPEKDGFGVKFANKEDYKKRSAGAGFYRSKNLERSVERMKKRINEKYKKNRVKLATEGKTFDATPKLIYKIFGNKLKSYTIQTDIPNTKLQDYIKENLYNFKRVELSSEQKRMFKQKNSIRSNKVEGARFGNLLVFKKNNEIFIHFEK